MNEPPPLTPVWSPLQLNLYIVVEDCAPGKENEGILYIHKGQIFDILDDTTDWWLARLVRDTIPKSPKFCEQGWIPASFLDKFEGQLGNEEYSLIMAGKKILSCCSLNRVLSPMVSVLQVVFY